ACGRPAAPPRRARTCLPDPAPRRTAPTGAGRPSQRNSSIAAVNIRASWKKTCGPRLAFDWGVGRLSPSDPRAVVDARVGIVEEMREREPRLARPVTDGAVGDQSLVLTDSRLL